MHQVRRNQKNLERSHKFNAIAMLRHYTYRRERGFCRWVKHFQQISMAGQVEINVKIPSPGSATPHKQSPILQYQVPKIDIFWLHLLFHIFCQAMQALTSWTLAECAAATPLLPIQLPMATIACRSLGQGLLTESLPGPTSVAVAALRCQMSLPELLLQEQLVLSAVSTQKEIILEQVHGY